MDLSLNRVENGNWLVLVPLTSWRKNRNIFSVKQACLNVPEVPRCPSLPYTLLWVYTIHTSLSPFLQLEHMALTLQIPLLNFNMGARHNPLSYCRYGDGYGCPWHAAYQGESEAVANFVHWYSPPFSWSVWQVTIDKQRVGSFIAESGIRHQASGNRQAVGLETDK